MKQKTEVQWGNNQTKSWLSEKKQVAQLQYTCTSEWYTAVKTEVLQCQQIGSDKIRGLWVRIKSYRSLRLRHHPLSGHGFGWTPGVGGGQGSLACCGSWGRKELDTTERLNWTENYFLFIYLAVLVLLVGQDFVFAVVCRVFSFRMRDLSSLICNQTRATWIGNMESSPLDHQWSHLYPISCNKL